MSYSDWLWCIVGVLAVSCAALVHSGIITEQPSDPQVVFGTTTNLAFFFTNYSSYFAYRGEEFPVCSLLESTQFNIKIFSDLAVVIARALDLHSVIPQNLPLDFEMLINFYVNTLYEALIACNNDSFFLYDLRKTHLANVQFLAKFCKLLFLDGDIAQCFIYLEPLQEHVDKQQILHNVSYEMLQPYQHKLYSVKTFEYAKMLLNLDEKLLGICEELLKQVLLKTKI